MVNYDEILDGTVDEVKEKIGDAEDLDYESLLKAEEDGKDRKTVKEYIERKIGEEVDEEINSDDASDSDVVDELENESSGGILGSYSQNSVFAGGLLIGLLIGLVAVGLSSPGMAGNQDQVSKDKAYELANGLVGQQAQVSETFVEENGLYTFNVTMTGQQNNETVTRTQTYYMTMDGKKIIPTQSPLTGQPLVIDVEQATQSRQTQGTDTGNNVSQ